ncbi:hypothetical protein LguiA_014482 [Lonicera macranthoides]
MSLSKFTTAKFCNSSSNLLPRSHGGTHTEFVKSIASSTTRTCDKAMSILTPARRLANYHPSIWEHDYVQSLTSHYAGDTCTRRASALKKEVRELIDKVGEPLTKLELIDTLQRLGISYHFEVEIKNELERIYNDHYRSERWNREDELMLRLEARWFIDVYERRRDMNTTLLEFAKLDFNMVQATHQEDLKHMSRWWKSTCLGEKLRFARDRLIENYFWTIGVIFEPEYQYCRRMSTKVNSLVTTIDDIYDVYATFQELQLFTNAVERWDLSAMEQLPDYMKICFLALYNSTNEMVYDTLVEQGVYIISYLKKVWADLCKSYLLEAKWYYSGYTPTLEEYMDNAWISISAPVILVHAHFFVTNPLTADSLECLKKYPDIIRWPSVILRLTNDLGTSIDELKRGDNPKSIHCYMHETGVSEDEAREHIKYLISETWKKINEEVHHQHQVLDSPFNKVFNGIAVNLARMAQCIYQHGDGHGIEDQETKDRVLALDEREKAMANDQEFLIESLESFLLMNLIAPKKCRLSQCMAAASLKCM